MPTLALVSTTLDLSKIGALIAQQRPDLTIVKHDAPEAAQADAVLCWKPHPGIWSQFPKLKLIHSIAAGVDHILSDPSVPAGLSICRIVDPRLTAKMAEYILWSVLYFHRGFDQMIEQHRERRWKRPMSKSAGKFQVGVMGLGAIGGEIARQLQAAGYAVRGWSRSPKHIEGIRSHAGTAELATFMDGLDLMICLLPLTDHTRGIVNARLIDMAGHAVALVHCGRSGHLVDEDVMAALQDGRLRGAVIDVFDHEPLAPDNAWWSQPHMLVTPHAAAVSSPDTIADQVVENLNRLDRGEPLLRRVHPELGY